jgi:Ala-tRNA(Pro) deacylase
MQPKLKSYLDNLGISFKEHSHPPAFTVEESNRLIGEIPNVFHTKSLFLKDNKSRFYLICMNANKRLNLKILRELFHVNKLHFASKEELKLNLNLTPGSVSIFGMIHAKPFSIKLILDSQLWKADKVGFHPNINTSTLEISHSNLQKFVNSLKADKQILDLEE